MGWSRRAVGATNSQVVLCVSFLVVIFAVSSCGVFQQRV
jgi:hypothetical protein